MAASTDIPPRPAGTAPAETAAWSKLHGAGDASAAVQPWLELAVATINAAVPGPDGLLGVMGAFVAMRGQDGPRFARVASVGEGAVSFLLAKSAERCLQVGRMSLNRDEPSSTVQLAVPIMRVDRLEGVVAMELPIASMSRIEEVTRLVQWGLGWFFRAPGEASTPDQDSWAWLAQVLDAAELPVALEAACTALATRVGLTRVSIGYGAAERMRVRGTSRGRLSDLPTDFVGSLSAVMNEAVEADTSLLVPAPEGQGAAVVAHQRLLRSREDVQWLVTLPAALPRPEGAVTHVALTLEGEGTPPAPELLEAWGMVAGRLAPAIAWRLRAERGLLGHAAAVVRPGPGKRPYILAAVAVAVLGLALFPVTHRINARATVEGMVRRTLAVPFDGYLAEASVRPGDRVTAGATLARMDDRELRLQRLDYQSRVNEARRQADEAIGRRDMAAAAIASARREQAEAELRLVESHITRSVLAAPYDAIVIAGDPLQSIGAPMRRGETVYEISPLESFRIALEVDEHDFGMLQLGQGGRLVLASLPYHSYRLEVVKVTPVASARDGRTAFRVEARLEGVEPQLRPGMQGIAKVEVGTSPLAWVWLRSVVNWARIKIWGWMP